MAPFGDEAPALELCRAASGGAGLDVVRPLALEAVARVVPAAVAVWSEADVARGGPTTTVVLPEGCSVCGFDRLLVRLAHGSSARSPEVPDGHALAIGLPAPVGFRAGIGLWRPDPFTTDEADRLIRVQPVIGCAVLAAWRAPAADAEGVLTRREAAVLRAVATGMSDKQVARALGVSPRTIGKHLEHIYAKLGVRGRTEAAALIDRSGQVAPALAVSRRSRSSTRSASSRAS
jgi:DNA-binding CsgD family transcriptional regulator